MRLSRIASHRSSFFFTLQYFLQISGFELEVDLDLDVELELEVEGLYNCMHLPIYVCLVLSPTLFWFVRSDDTVRCVRTFGPGFISRSRN